MYFKQSSIVPVLVTLTPSNLGEVEKKSRQTKSLMSLININSAQNKGTDKVSFFSHAKRLLHSDSGPIVHALEDVMSIMKMQKM